MSSSRSALAVTEQKGTWLLDLATPRDCPGRRLGPERDDRRGPSLETEQARRRVKSSPGPPHAGPYGRPTTGRDSTPDTHRISPSHSLESSPFPISAGLPGRTPREGWGAQPFRASVPLWTSPRSGIERAHTERSTDHKHETRGLSWGRFGREPDRHDDPGSSADRPAYRRPGGGRLRHRTRGWYRAAVTSGSGVRDGSIVWPPMPSSRKPGRQFKIVPTGRAD